MEIIANGPGELNRLSYLKLHSCYLEKIIKIGWWAYSKPRQCPIRDVVYSMTEETISGVHISPGSAGTLVRRGGITNHHSIAYFVSSKSKLVDVHLS